MAKVLPRGPIPQGPQFSLLLSIGQLVDISHDLIDGIKMKISALGTLDRINRHQSMVSKCRREMNCPQPAQTARRTIQSQLILTPRPSSTAHARCRAGNMRITIESNGYSDGSRSSPQMR